MDDLSSGPAAQPRIIVLTAPSGAGKSSIARKVLRVMPHVTFSVSATTRAPRDGETDGVHYHFLAAEEFDERIRGGDFVEYEEVYPGLLYGTLVAAVDAATTEHPVLLDIDVQGALRVKKIFGDDTLAIFIAPPSFEELEQRLTGRGTETSADVHTRLDRARVEMTFQNAFDCSVVNDDLEIATDEAISQIARFLQHLPLKPDETHGRR